MKAFNIIVVLIFLISAVYFIGSAFLPSESTIERSLVVKAPVEIVFAQVDSFWNWSKWSYWHRLDPDAKGFLDEPVAGTGSSYSWKGEKIEGGKITITESIPNTLIRLDYEVGKNRGKGYFKFDKASGGTRITQSLTCKWSYFNRISGLLFAKIVAPVLESNLIHLSQVTYREQAKASGIDFVQIENQWALAIRDTTNLENITPTLNAIYQNISIRIESVNGDKTEGKAFAIWHKIDSAANFADVEAGITISDSLSLAGVRLLKLGGNVLKGTHRGSYDSLKSTYDKLTEYLKINRLAAKTAPWEIYTVGPYNQLDTAKWETEIYFPL